MTTDPHTDPNEPIHALIRKVRDRAREAEDAHDKYAAVDLRNFVRSHFAALYAIAAEAENAQERWQPELPTATLAAITEYAACAPAYTRLVELEVERNAFCRLVAECDTLVPPALAERHNAHVLNTARGPVTLRRREPMCPHCSEPIRNGHSKHKLHDGLVIINCPNLEKVE